jgi:FdhE protein
MQRILDPAQIEAFAERDIPRVRLPDPAVFRSRAARLSACADGHALRDYLLLMAALADAQQGEFDSLRSALTAENFAGQLGRQIEVAREHGMPVLQAAGWPRQDRWRDVLRALCSVIAASSQPTRFPPVVYTLCARLAAASDADLDVQADLLITSRIEVVGARGTDGADGADGAHGVDAQAAPFIMAALQVYWAAMASTLRLTGVAQLDVPTVCPVCGTLPVASVVRADKRGPQGYRYLHCGLCETEWHSVRITCSHCLSTEGITYHSIEGSSEAIRAEACGQCHTYRKILYQEKDSSVEPVADDLSSLALDLLMTDEGVHRASGNPLLWQTSEL